MAEIVCRATMMDAGGEAEAVYEFTAEESLFDRSPIYIVKHFMEYVDHVELPGEHLGYELYSTIKNKDLKVVTAMGSLLLPHGEIPFMVMIAPKDLPKQTVPSR